MDTEHTSREDFKRLHHQHRDIIKSFESLSSQPLDAFASKRNFINLLENRGFVEVRDEQVFLLPLGNSFLEAYQNPNRHKLKPSPTLIVEDHHKEDRKQKRLEKSNQFLELYKQGLSYQGIGDLHNLSRERVRQILDKNPAFHEYLVEREDAEAATEKEKKELAKKEFYSKSLAARYPDRVKELWDYDKNGDLRPEEILAGSTQQNVWFKCPIDGHSWKKTPANITPSWWRSGTSGCPMCAGKMKKAEKQPAIGEAYPEFIKQYWDYAKNNTLNSDPKKLTLASNKKVWFKCPHDGNEWQASIALTVSQQWSKENPGCQICNGTADRKRGKWRRREPIAVEFPNEVAKY